MRRLLTRYKVKYLALGGIFALLTFATGSFATRYQNDERELKKIRAEQAKSADIRKVQAYYLHKNPRLWGSLAGELAAATVDAAAGYKIPLEIQVAVNCSESNAHPFAESKTGAKGLGQVDFDAWHEELGQGNPFEPRYNQIGTAYVLSTCIRKHGLWRGLELYNVGEGNYKKGKRNKRYVSEVFAGASEFRYFTVEAR